MITNNSKKKGPKRFHFDPVSVSPKSYCITNNIIQHINNERMLSQGYGRRINNQKKLNVQLNQLISNHEYPKTSIERLIRLKYINKQLNMKLHSRQLLDYYICKIENVILKDKLKMHEEIAAKFSEWEEYELAEIRKLNEEIEGHILDSINKIKPQNDMNKITDVVEGCNIEFENYMKQLIAKSLANKTGVNVAPHNNA